MHEDEEDEEVTAQVGEQQVGHPIFFILFFFQPHKIPQKITYSESLASYVKVGIALLCSEEEERECGRPERRLDGGDDR